MVKKIISKTKAVSKMAINEKNLKQETVPNPIVLGGMPAIGIQKIDPSMVPKYLLMHPALPRGIEIKANRMIKLLDEDLKRNVITNSSKGEKAKEARDYCRRILYDSGGPLFVKSLSQDTYSFGTGFYILQTNRGESEVLRFEEQHPIFFGPNNFPNKVSGAGWEGIKREYRSALMGKMKIDPKTKQISEYTQLTYKYPETANDNNYCSGTYVNTQNHPELKNGGGKQLVAVGDPFKKSQVVQLVFNKIGDEPLGISLVQPLKLTIDYLLSMEQAGAQTQVNFGFNKWKATTPFKDAGKMQQFAKSLSKINVDAVVVLPEGVDLANIKPEKTDFAEVHPLYLRLIAMRLGIPMPLLTQDGTETNKATIQEQRKDMHDDFRADELIIERTINESFFKSCQIKYPDLDVNEIEKIVPKFKFGTPPEDTNIVIERDLKFSLTVRNYASAAKSFSPTKDWAGESAVVKVLADYVVSILTDATNAKNEESGIDKE